MRTGTVRAVVAAVLACAPLVSRAQARPATRAPKADVARLTITRPTVIAYLVVPEGAVDTCPDLATIADDWSYAMATLGDSLEAHGVAHVLVTEPALRVASRGARPVTIALGETGATGYVFVRPGARPCLRREYLDADSVLAIANRFLAPAAPTRARPERCDPLPRP